MSATPFRFNNENQISRILDTMRYLCLTISECGVCYGITAMAIQAAKHGDLVTFLNRMHLIQSFHSQADLNTALGAALEKRKAKELLTTREKLLCSILVFLEGVSLFHSNMHREIKFDLLLPDLARREAARHLSEVYTALGITKQDYLKADRFFNQVPGDSIKEFASEKSNFLAADLESRLDDLACTRGNLAIHLGNPSHSIALVRDGSKWVLINHDVITCGDDLAVIKSIVIAALKLKRIEMTLIDIHYHIGNEAEINEILCTKSVDHGALITQLYHVLPLYHKNICDLIVRRDIKALDEILKDLSGHAKLVVTELLRPAELPHYQHAMADFWRFIKLMICHYCMIKLKQVMIPSWLLLILMV